MARTSFILFLILSTPIGIHHQYTDPGIHQGWKLLHALFTFAVFFPSLLTFFNVVASLETGGRARGGAGWVNWFGRLPWSDPSLAAQVLAMVLFAFGGVGGAIVFLSALLYFLNMVLTVTVSRRAPQPAPEFADALSGPDHAPAFLDRWRPWLVASAVLIVIAYGPTLVRLVTTTPLNT